MPNKRRARELALQFLYQIDIGRGDVMPALDEFLSTVPDGSRYARSLIAGCVDRREDLDSQIARWSENWDIGRMAVVDRNVLRIGVFEMLFCDDIPPKVAIDEAIEIAKSYGDADSPGFVNGVLDGIYQSHLATTKEH